MNLPKTYQLCYWIDDSGMYVGHVDEVRSVIGQANSLDALQDIIRDGLKNYFAFMLRQADIIAKKF